MSLPVFTFNKFNIAVFNHIIKLIALFTVQAIYDLLHFRHLAPAPYRRTYTQHNYAAKSKNRNQRKPQRP